MQTFASLTSEKKEQNIKFCFVCTLSDSDLVHKPLALILTAMIYDILQVYHTHIASVNNMSVMGLSSPKSLNTICK